MIFLTVGTIFPFDRLVRAVDNWVGAHSEFDVFGQIGNVGEGNYTPKNFAWNRRLKNAEFRERIKNSDFVIGHAGIGSIIETLQLGKQIVILPREKRFNEHVNDHQLQTIRRFSERPGIHGAKTEQDLPSAIDRALSAQAELSQISKDADPSLISAIRLVIDGGTPLSTKPVRSDGDPCKPHSTS